MVIGIFVFAFVGRPVWYWLIASRILLLPVIAGLAYELIRFAGKHQDNSVLMTLLAPGLWLQRLTTREPTLDQIEVSIRALEEVRRREASETPAEQAEDRKVEVMAVDARGSSARRTSSWEGNLARGAGALTAASSGAFERAAVPLADAGRRARRQDEPGGAARGRARRLLHHVARR